MLFCELIVYVLILLLIFYYVTKFDIIYYKIHENDKNWKTIAPMEHVDALEVLRKPSTGF